MYINQERAINYFFNSGCLATMRPKQVILPDVKLL